MRDADMGFHRPVSVQLDLTNGGNARAYASTFAIGHVALQVFGSELHDGAERSFREGSAISRALAQIWPYVGSVKLPPQVVMTLSELELVAEAFNGPRGA
jgi:hypothetical protein